MKISHGICLPLSDLLHLVWSSLVPFMLLQMALFHSFLGMSSIPLYICTMYSLFNHLLMDIFFCELKHFHLFFLFKSNYSKRVSPSIAFGKDSKAGRGAGKFHCGKKGRLHVCPGWRLPTWGSHRWERWTRDIGWLGAYTWLSPVGPKLEVRGGGWGKWSVMNQVLAVWAVGHRGFGFLDQLQETEGLLPTSLSYG